MLTIVFFFFLFCTNLLYFTLFTIFFCKNLKEMASRESKKCSLKIKKEDFFPAKVLCRSDFEVIKKIRQKLTDTQMSIFRSSCFGKLIDMQDLQFSAQIVHHLLLRQLDCSKEDDMWFLIAGKKIRFSLHEFNLVTGLNCGPFMSIDEYKNLSSKRLLDEHFNSVEDVSKSLVQSVFLNCTSSNDEDVVKLALLYLLEILLLGKESKNKVDKSHLAMVDNLELFNAYPWGKIVFDMTIKSLSTVMIDRVKKFQKKKENNLNHIFESYALIGFPYAFQVFFFYYSFIFMCNICSVFSNFTLIMIFYVHVM